MAGWPGKGQGIPSQIEQVVGMIKQRIKLDCVFNFQTMPGGDFAREIRNCRNTDSITRNKYFLYVQTFKSGSVIQICNFDHDHEGKIPVPGGSNKHSF